MTTPGEQPAPTRRASSLGWRIVAMTLLVAGRCTVAALVSISAVRQTAREANATRLSQQAELLVIELERSAGTPADHSELLDALAAQGISVVLIDGTTAQSTDRRAQRAVRAAGLLDSGAILPVATSVDLGGSPVLVEIRDGGPGLEPDDYRDMFQPRVLHDRYRYRRPGGGAGLGLALAAGLVARMGGTIEGRPAPEGGVCVAVRLRPADVGGVR